MSNKFIGTISLFVPVALNKLCNRLDIHVEPRSDTTILQSFFYECDGRYWFNFNYYGQSLNSCVFLSLRNCVFGFQDTVRGLSFSLSDSDQNCLRDFVNNWEQGLKAKKGVA